jgi:hypothetical protein
MIHISPDYHQGNEIPEPLASRKKDSYRWHPRSYPPPPIAASHKTPSTVNYAQDGFSLQIQRRRPGKELQVNPPRYTYINQTANHRPDGYVEVDDGEAYRVNLTNSHGSPCDVTLKVDDEEIGTFRIKAYGQISLEGPPNDGRRFTFYKAGTVKGWAAGIQPGKETNGVVSATFVPAYPTEKHPVLMNYSRRTPTDGFMATECVAAKSFVPGTSIETQTSIETAHGGATGLAGHTDQRFHLVENLDLDYSRKCTISCRLICVSGREPTRVLEPATMSFF